MDDYLPGAGEIAVAADIKPLVLDIDECDYVGWAATVTVGSRPQHIATMICSNSGVVMIVEVVSDAGISDAALSTLAPRVAVSGLTQPEE